LHDELKQTKPFRSLEQEAYLSIVRSASVLSDRMEQLLKPSGITLAQYNVLRILRGGPAEGLCRNEVRDRMIDRMPDMTRLLDRMVDAGLVTRERTNPEDRRMVHTVITAKGRRLVDGLDAHIEAEHTKSLGHLSKTELRKLIETLQHLRNTE
jgi:DNA-binding MarR family transcriptional regulator